MTSVAVERVKNFHSRALAANRATLIIVGPAEARTTVAMLERNLRDWQPSSEASPGLQLPSIGAGRSKPAMLDRPQRTQAAIFAALPIPPRRDSAIDSLVVANAMLGGMFNSRLNRSLREAMGWSYGGYSRMLYARHAGLWIAYSFVRLDRVAAAIDQIRRAFPGIDGNPIDEAEFGAARDYLVASGPARYETNAQVADALRDQIMHLANGGFDDRLTRLHFEGFTAACTRHVNAESIAWLVIGDAARLAGELAAAGLDGIETLGEADL